MLKPHKASSKRTSSTAAITSPQSTTPDALPTLVGATSTASALVAASAGASKTNGTSSAAGGEKSTRLDEDERKESTSESSNAPPKPRPAPAKRQKQGASLFIPKKVRNTKHSEFALPNPCGDSSPLRDPHKTTWVDLPRNGNDHASDNKVLYKVFPSLSVRCRIHIICFVAS